MSGPRPFGQSGDGGLARALRERRDGTHGVHTAALFGVVSLLSANVLEFFREREDAEAFIENVRLGEPELAELLCVEAIE